MHFCYVLKFKFNTRSLLVVNNNVVKNYLHCYFEYMGDGSPVRLNHILYALKI